MIREDGEEREICLLAPGTFFHVAANHCGRNLLYFKSGFV